ncbi:MAG: sporulation protein YabP [Oscillospiraceae bacterium]|nr:sporulation protein YabP [Oscillospiraceae bacterium]
MAEDKRVIKMKHNVIMENRRTLTVTGVMDIDSFDEETVTVFTEHGELTIKGRDLHINKIDVDTGDLLMEGDVDSLSYSDNLPQKGGFFSKLLR